MKIKELSALFIAGGMVVSAAYADTAWPVRENKYNLERAQAQLEFAKKLEAENGKASPERIRQIRKEVFSNADKTRKQEMGKVQSVLLSLVLGVRPLDAKPSEAGGALAESKKDLVKPDEKSDKPSRSSSGPARSTASQKRVTTTGADKLGSSGAEAVSFKGSSGAPSQGTSAAGEGDVTSGGAEAIQFGGKK